MTKPHLHKADLSPHRATDMRCLPKYQYFLRLSGCSFTHAHKYAAQEVAFHSYSVKNCKANNIVGSGLRHQNPERPDHPTGVSSSQVEPAHKQLLGCATPTMVFVQTCAGAENQAEMLHVLGNAQSQRTHGLRCLQKTMRKVGNALEVAQLMQNGLSSQSARGFQRTIPPFKSRNTRVKLLAR